MELGQSFTIKCHIDQLYRYDVDQPIGPNPSVTPSSDMHHKDLYHEIVCPLTQHIPVFTNVTKSNDNAQPSTVLTNMPQPLPPTPKTPLGKTYEGPESAQPHPSESSTCQQDPPHLPTNLISHRRNNITQPGVMNTSL